ncbi:MAG: hypothetical protein AB7S77_15145 [Desulfatirhabdiaceae bacterium]
MGARFASSVAVAGSPLSGSRTGVYVLDGDANRLVYRDRRADSVSSGSVLQPFAYYDTIRSSPDGSTRISAYKIPDTGLPAILALGSSGLIFETFRQGNDWTSWQSLALPSAGVVADMDVASDRNGIPTLFAVTSASGGALYFNKRNAIGQNTSWPNNWTLISDEDGTYIYSRVTAIRHHGDQSNQVWTLTTTGAIRTATETALNSWGTVSSFPLPSLHWYERIVDIDAAWSTAQTALLVALSSEGRSWYCEATLRAGRQSHRVKGEAKSPCRVEHLQDVSSGALRFLDDDPPQPDDSGCTEKQGCHHRRIR